jgi:hypothetical protein
MKISTSKKRQGNGAKKDAGEQEAFRDIETARSFGWDPQTIDASIDALASVAHVERKELDGKDGKPRIEYWLDSERRLYPYVSMEDTGGLLVRLDGLHEVNYGFVSCVFPSPDANPINVIIKEEWKEKEEKTMMRAQAEANDDEPARAWWSAKENDGNRADDGEPA